jgi:hypothetical protein
MVKFGDFLSTDEMPTGASGPIGYIGMSETGTAVSSTATAVTFLTTTGFPMSSDRWYRIHAFAPMGALSGTGTWDFQIDDGTTTYTIARASSPPGYSPINATLLYRPPADATKVFRFKGTPTSGSASFSCGANIPSYPIRVWIEDLGGTEFVANNPGIVASDILTTSLGPISVGSTMYVERTLSVPLTAGAYYRLGYLTPINKAVSGYPLNIYFQIAGVNSGILWAIDQSAPPTGSVSLSVLFVPSTTGTITLGMAYYVQSGTASVTWPGSATAPRQIWVERLSV